MHEHSTKIFISLQFALEIMPIMGYNDLNDKFFGGFYA